MIQDPDKPDRKQLESRHQCADAMTELAGRLVLDLAIHSPSLPDDLFGYPQFLEALKTRLLAQSRARVRILLDDPDKTLRNGCQLLDLSRKLSSFIEIRQPQVQNEQESREILIQDCESVVLCKPSDSRIAWLYPNDRFFARHCLQDFNQTWETASRAGALRQLHI